MASLVIPYCIAASTVISTKYGCHAGDETIYCSDDSGLVYEQFGGQCTKILIGHTASISTIVYMNKYPIEEWPEETAIAIIDCTGAIGVWSMLDGRCLLFHVEPMLKKPIGMVCIRNLLVIGDSGDDGKLVFFNSVNLELVYVINCDGLTAICGHAQPDNQVLIIANTLLGLRVFSIDGHRATEIECDWLPKHAKYITSSSNYRYLLVLEETKQCTLYQDNAIVCSIRGDDDNVKVVLNDGRLLKTATFDLKINADFFSPSQFAQLNDQMVVMGGQSGQYCALTINDLINKQARAFHQGPFKAEISAILTTTTTVWMGNASGCLFSFDINKQDKILLSLRISKSPIIKLIEFGNYLLAISQSFSIAIINLKSSNAALLYSIHQQPAPIALHFGIDDCVLMEQPNHRFVKLDLNSGSVDQMLTIDNARFGQKVLLEQKQEKELLHPLLHMLPHGLLKVLCVSRSFPGALITLDIRALISEVMIRKSPALVEFSHSLLALLRKPDGVGIVGANGNISVSLVGREKVSPAEAAIMKLTITGLAMSLSEDLTLPNDFSPTQRYPSLSILSKFWCDFVKPLEGASRAILKSIVANHGNRFDQTVMYWEERLTNPPLKSHHIAPMNRAAIILSILTLFKASDLLVSPALSKAIGCSLFGEVEDERKHLFRLAAVHLFGKCFAHWEAYVDGSIVIRLLFSWLSSASLHADPWTTTLLKVSKDCIIDMLTISPNLFNALCTDMITGKIDASHSLSIVFDFIKNQPAVVDKHVCLIAESIVKTLDPSNPRQRARLLPTATPLLYEIVTKFKHIAFNSARQLLASGRLDGVVSVWDASSSVRVLKLSVHSQPVSYLLFDQDGQHVISYSLSEGVIAVTSVDEPSTMSLVISSLAGGRIDDDSRVIKRLMVPDEITACINGSLVGNNHHGLDKILSMTWVHPSSVKMCVEGGREFTIPI